MTVTDAPVSRSALIRTGAGYSRPIAFPASMMSREFIIMTSMHGPGSDALKGSQKSSIWAMLRDEIDRLSDPNLLHKKTALDAELLQASLQSFCICAEEPFYDYRILDCNIRARVGVGPLFSVLFKHLKLCREMTGRRHFNSSKILRKIPRH